MLKNRQFDFAIRSLLLIALIFVASTVARAESVHGRFFNGQTYIGEYLIAESSDADGMRVSPVAIKLKVEKEKNLLQYTYVANDLPSVKASGMGFLSIVVNSGGMEGSVTYNYVIPGHGVLTSIGTVQTHLHLGKIESIDARSNKNFSIDEVNFFVRQIGAFNPSALSEPSNAYSAAMLLLLGQGKFLTPEDELRLSALCGNKEISDDPVLLQAMKRVIGCDAQAYGSIQAPNERAVVSNRVFFFNSPKSLSIEKSYLIKGIWINFECQD
ncbi:hypothetical protein F6X40_16595 [Paraburkholderia sp. UCT31]|uniref:hypothetical protein n=1 Tax=Paraburkholderia sp. UCT31 TaxID=2615209 RepID=UPI0016566C8D|nr:hypothetical protein [Paraburkholderia sp. UCT31]MBC8738395.1 hypothetical protein [Paraburkholderia sp. UCT31]